MSPAEPKFKSSPKSTSERVRFQTPHLERVSRSFAFGIARLDTDLRSSVGLGYLICRLLDTIEDAPWSSHEEQCQAFLNFNSFLTDDPVDRSRVLDWASRFPDNIPDGERLLLQAAPEVFEEFVTLDESSRTAMLKPILSMSRGMRAFTERGALMTARAIRLESLGDVNTYCFFVAGVVGELLTGLVQKQMRPIGLETSWRLATHFGLFLQKVNVLKDQWTDERENRFLVPSRAGVLQSLRANANFAFEYLIAIPIARKDYRLFCAWALFLGLATIPLLKVASASDAKPAKIPKLQALALGAKIELSISDNRKLSELFDDLLKAAWSEASGAPSIELSPEMREILSQNYDGALSISQLEAVLTET